MIKVLLDVVGAGFGILLTMLFFDKYCEEKGIRRYLMIIGCVAIAVGNVVLITAN